MAPLPHRPFGRTGLALSPLALGGHEFLGNGRSRGFNEDMAKAVTAGYIVPGFGGPKRIELLKAAYDASINIFDVTIDAEKEALGRNLKELPPPYEVYVQTRPEGMCYSYDPGNRSMLDYAKLSAEVERALKLLRRETIDFYNIGLLNWSIDETPDFLDRLGDNLQRLRQAGKIRFAVADSFSGERLYLAQMACGAFDAINLDLSRGERAGLATVVPRARELGLGLVAREAFFKGELFDIGAEIGVTDKAALARLALAFVVRQDPGVILLGVDNADQLRANVNTFFEASDIGDDALLRRLEASPRYQTYAETRERDFRASR
jgi:aryl-alcohol dehydrogenase-like predicted oxidoreductase